MENKLVIKPRSIGQTISYSMAHGIGEFMGSAINTFLAFYYTVVVGMDIWWYAFAQIIYAVYNAVNDPFIGYFCDKPHPKMDKYGKRFPWIMIGSVGIIFTMQMVYNVPLTFHGNNLMLCFWMTIALCLTDTAYSLFFVNQYALGPALYRSPKNRRQLGTISTAVSTLFLLLGMVVPSMFASQEDPSSFGTFTLISGGVILILTVLMIPGIKESPAVTQRLVSLQLDSKDDKFFPTLLQALKQKNFMIYIIVYLMFSTIALTALGSLPFFVIYVLERPPAEMMYMVIAEFLAVFAFVPIWGFIGKKYGFKTGFVIAGIILSIGSAIILVINSMIFGIIAFGFLGAAVAGFWVFLSPIFSDSVDEVSVKIGKHQESTYSGIKTFFARLALIIQALIYAVIRTITGFDPNTTTTVTEAQKFGIRFEMVGVSMILLLVSIIVFAYKYDITTEKMKGIRAQLDEMEK